MFGSFGLVGFSSFIVQDDSELISTFMSDLKNESEENMTNLYSFTFLPNVFLRLSDSEHGKLSVTCRGLLTFFTAFAISQNLDQIKIQCLQSASIEEHSCMWSVPAIPTR